MVMRFDVDVDSVADEVDGVGDVFKVLLLRWCVVVVVGVVVFIMLGRGLRMLLRKSLNRKK